ncbi:uncharacterized protein VP01_925g4 [Puccinia sorghi]|uniref:Retrotransposon gag domain-containing protein n=1 Tax=Puccinia sorghi TaxID=27349 RepID=A0A0L6U774_9BASI|nr:uncharacterized protein VP01_925g4 [Puccinia sorghi]
MGLGYMRFTPEGTVGDNPEWHVDFKGSEIVEAGIWEVRWLSWGKKQCEDDHTVTYPKRFPTDTSKVAFSVLFMRDYAATWSQTYLDKVFHKVPVVFDDFLNNFRSSFFDHNHLHRAKVALRNLCQTGTVQCKQWPRRRVRQLKEFNKTTPLPPSPVQVPAPPPPTLMQWTSPHSRGPQSIDSPTPSKPTGFS